MKSKSFNIFNSVLNDFGYVEALSGFVIKWFCKTNQRNISVSPTKLIGWVVVFLAELI